MALPESESVVRTPLSARIGIYLILTGIIFDLVLHYAGGVEYAAPGIGLFSIVLFPLGLILLAGTAIFQIIALRRERAQRISLTSPGPQSGGVQTGPGPSPSRHEQRIEIGSPLRRSAWVGMGLVLLGIALFTGIQYWMATRTFYTPRSDHEDSITPALWLAALAIAVGTSLLVLFVLAHYRCRVSAATDITDSESVSQHFQWAQKLPLSPAFAALPSFGLICALVLSWLVMFHMVFYQFGRFRSKGIRISVLRQVAAAEDGDRWAEPLVIRVQAAGPGLPPKIYLNSNLLPRAELKSRLKTELSRRSVWTVYVEADSDVSWQDAVSAIDAARSLNAKVVLLTPSQH